MHKIYLELTVDDNGNITGSKTIARNKIRERKIGTKAIPHRILDECEGVRLLREAMLLFGGGPASIAAAMGVSRSNIYQFIYRNKVSDKNIEKLRKIISENSLTTELE